MFAHVYVCIFLYLIVWLLVYLPFSRLFIHFYLFVNYLLNIKYLDINLLSTCVVQLTAHLRVSSFQLYMRFDSRCPSYHVCPKSFSLEHRSVYWYAWARTSVVCVSNCARCTREPPLLWVRQRLLRFVNGGLHCLGRGKLSGSYLWYCIVTFSYRYRDTIFLKGRLVTSLPVLKTMSGLKYTAGNLCKIYSYQRKSCLPLKCDGK